MPVCVLCVYLFFIYLHKERRKQNTYSDITPTVQDLSLLFTQLPRASHDTQVIALPPANFPT